MRNRLLEKPHDESEEDEDEVRYVVYGKVRPREGLHARHVGYHTLICCRTANAGHPPACRRAGKDDASMLVSVFANFLFLLLQRNNAIEEQQD